MAIGGVDETQTTQTLECESEGRGGLGCTQGRAVGRSQSHDGPTRSCDYVLENGLPSGGGQAGFQAGESAKEKTLAVETTSLKAKVGSLVMDNDLLYEKIARLEDGLPFHLRKSTC